MYSFYFHEFPFHYFFFKIIQKISKKRHFYTRHDSGHQIMEFTPKVVPKIHNCLRFATQFDIFLFYLEDLIKKGRKLINCKNILKRG